MKTVYIVPWWDCNLRCPHCFIPHDAYKMDSTKLLKELSNLEDCHCVLFGGEPLLHPIILKEILNSGKINSISTNMLLWEDSFNINNNISIATSWNPTRFTEEQRSVWKNNIKKATRKGHDVMLLITLDELLLKEDPLSICYLLSELEQVGVTSFQFEPYIGEQELHLQADDWLCEFYSWWIKQSKYDHDSNIHCTTFDKVKEGWFHDCSNVRTLEPEGNLRQGCPNLVGAPHTLLCCMDCGQSSHCKPCCCLKQCSYPHKLAKLIMS